MRPRLKIYHYQLALVAIPLLFELIFVAVLTSMLFEAEKDLKREILSKEITYRAGVFGRYVAEGATVAAAYSTSSSDFFRDRYENNKLGFRRSIKELKELVVEKGDREQIKRVNNVEQIAEKGQKILDQVIDDTDRRRRGQASASRFHGPVAMMTTKRLIDSLIKETQLILTEENELARQYSINSARSRKRVHYLLMAFVGFSIGAAFLLNKWFSVYITRRLKAVIDNTQKVPKGEALSPPIGGTDEIAQLDKVFHEMVDELYSAQKMKQYLLSMVSHDLRSPLTSVQGMLTMMAAGAFGELSEKARGRVAAAENELGRLIKMTNDLLDVERLASGKLEMHPEPVQASDILQAAVGSMQALADQHQVKLFSDSPEIELAADRERLIQVVINLLSNAIKYSPEGSTVLISASEVRDSAGQDRVIFKVTDEGRGIPEEFIEKIFERFQQVEESDATEKGGKGLGLAICKSIVDAHSGVLSVESEVGRGSTFWFSIPASCK